MVLITNASALDAPEVQPALALFTPGDEVWAKLDAGTPEHFAAINRTLIPLERIPGNILLTARKRPVIIQSLFAALNGTAPSHREISESALRLRELKRTKSRGAPRNKSARGEYSLGRRCALWPPVLRFIR